MEGKPITGALLALLLSAGLSGGCSKPVERHAAANDAVPPSVEAIGEPDSVRADTVGEEGGVPADRWVGRWTGPEGLFLDIQPSPNGQKGRYAISNRDTLDRQADYEGVATGDGIRFTRDGKLLMIRAGSGGETGFKYLAGKSDCLIVVAGQEGYCR